MSLIPGKPRMYSTETGESESILSEIVSDPSCLAHARWQKYADSVLGSVNLWVYPTPTNRSRVHGLVIICCRIVPRI